MPKARKQKAPKVAPEQRPPAATRASSTASDDDELESADADTAPDSATLVADTDAESGADSEEAKTLAELPTSDEAAQIARLQSPVQRFLTEARRYARLTDEDEKVLIRAVRERGDKEAARKLV